MPPIKLDPMNTSGKGALVPLEQSSAPSQVSRSAFGRNNPDGDTIPDTSIERVLQGARDAAAQTQNRLSEFRLIHVGSGNDSRGKLSH